MEVDIEPISLILVGHGLKLAFLAFAKGAIGKAALHKAVHVAHGGVMHAVGQQWTVQTASGTTSPGCAVVVEGSTVFTLAMVEPSSGEVNTNIPEEADEGSDVTAVTITKILAMAFASPFMCKVFIKTFDVWIALIERKKQDKLFTVVFDKRELHSLTSSNISAEDMQIYLEKIRKEQAKGKIIL